MIYLIGSLRNPKIPEIAVAIEKATGQEVFADWFAPGEFADDKLKEYSKARGRTYAQALQSHAVQHVFNFDKSHIDRADIVVLAAPAGRSGHLELGYSLGKGKKGYILFDGEPEERWDIMLLFSTRVCFSLEELLEELKIKGDSN